MGSKETPLSYCAAAVRRADPDRYLCALFAPAAARNSLFALYAFNLEIATVREVVREAPLGHMRLQWWRDAIADIQAGKVATHPVAEGLAETMDRTRLTADSFERLLAGREIDLDDAPPATLDALIDYADRTSAGLVTLALEALDLSAGAALVAARHVGIAWALIGLVRSVPFHARSRRAYLPRDLMLRHGVTYAALFDLRPVSGIQNLSRELVDVAREHLRQARVVRADVPKGAIPALLPAAFADADIKCLHRANYDPFDTRVARRGIGRQWRVVWRGLSGRF